MKPLARAAKFLVPALLALVSAPDAAARPTNHPGNEVGFYIATWSEVQPEDDRLVAQAHEVFARVAAVADKNSKRLPQLVVINSPGDPWAIALPAGHIVLSKQALTVCNEVTSPYDACVAFVLGHELAHLAHDDFIHREVLAFLTDDDQETARSATLSDLARVHERELAADDAGFVYAAMAGFAVGQLIRPGTSDFFEQWVRQTNARLGAEGTSRAQRAEVVRRRLADLQGKLAFFDFGVRLAHFDYCDDAMYFLREFQRVFPGREVLNNLGLCSLQLARQEMDAARAYFYWMPLLLDGETRAAAQTRQGSRTLKALRQGASDQASGYLDQALEYLGRAVAADPSYLPARLNLTVAHLYLGKPHQARAVLEEARTIDPTNPALQELLALALYEQGDAGLDLWPEAVKRLERLAAAADASPSVRFNLARLLEARPRPSEAREHWNVLAVQAGRLPTPIRQIVCSRQSALPARTCGRTANTAANGPWSWPLAAKGFPRLTTAAARDALPGWKATAFDWYKGQLHGHFYERPDGGSQVLELDQFVQMQVLKAGDLGNVQSLPSYCGQPPRKRSVPHGILWTCEHWAALIRNHVIAEVWWIAR